MQFVLAGKLLSGSPTEALTKKYNVIWNYKSISINPFLLEVSHTALDKNIRSGFAGDEVRYSKK